MNPQILEVGGCIRDEFMGIKSKDIDFMVVVDSYDQLRDWCNELRLEIFEERPTMLCIRARWPKSFDASWFSPRFAGKTADFVAPRSDGPYSDGRHPDYTEVGDIYTDLARRDFTVNAIARDVRTGEIIDPHDGCKDVERRILRCVGNDPRQRFTEDGLRALRALRFKITKGFEFDHILKLAMWSDWIVPILDQIDPNRARAELAPCFKTDTVNTLYALWEDISDKARDAIFSNGLRLEPTQKE